MSVAGLGTKPGTAGSRVRHAVYCATWPGPSDQTTPEQSNLRLHYLLRPMCPDSGNKYGNLLS